MTDESQPSDGTPPTGTTVSGWPTTIEGITESVVATQGPNDRWNQAALGIHAGDPVTAVTWGNTRTRRNFEREGGGYVQFTPDPGDFVEAALTIYETDGPILESTASWVQVTVQKTTEEEVDGTVKTTWQLAPETAAVRERTVPTTNRGYGAVIEATVAASRLDVDVYDTQVLVDRLEYFGSVVERCGGPAEQRAFDRIGTLVEWEE